MGLYVCWMVLEQEGLNSLADDESWETMTKRINGGLVGLDDRINKIHKAMDILGA